MREQGLVHGLKQAWSKISVQLVSRIDNLPRNFIFVHFLCALAALREISCGLKTSGPSLGGAKSSPRKG
jgi:hypothetical protein